MLSIRLFTAMHAVFVLFLVVIRTETSGKTSVIGKMSLVLVASIFLLICEFSDVPILAIDVLACSFSNVLSF